MIGWIWVLALAFSSGIVGEHDAMIAVFKISQEGKEILVDLTFDKEDYHSITGLKSTDLNEEQLTQYLNETTDWKINGHTAEHLTVYSVDIQGEHYHAECRMESNEEHITTFSIRNEFLLPLDGHSNICLLYTSPSPRDRG